MMWTLLTLACATTPATPPSEIAAEPAALDASAFGDAYTVLEAPQVSGSSVQLQVRYGGGCQVHDWSLVAIEPVEQGVLGVALAHDGHGDLCKAIKVEALSLGLGSQGLDLCGVSTLNLALPSDEAPTRHELAVPAAFSVCEGIVPQGAAGGEGDQPL